MPAITTPMIPPIVNAADRLESFGLFEEVLLRDGIIVGILGVVTVGTNDGRVVGRLEGM
jgi:hypothetical protein